MAKTKIPGEYLKDSVVRFTAKAGENITKGQSVYISGISGEVPVVSLADADDTNKMPAFGLAESTVSTNESIEITSNGTLAGIDTSSFSLGDILYISTTAGSLTNDPSGLEASKVQNIGMVQRVHASNGSIKVGGAGRTNATPNLNDGNIFVGNSSNKSVSDAFTDVLNDQAGINSSANATAITIDSSENVGIGTASPTADLSVGSTATSSGDVHLRTTKTAFSITPSNTDAGGILLDLGWVSGGQGPMKFGIGSSEKMRIDSSGNLLVSKIASSFNAAGAEIRDSGVVIGTVDGAAGLIANRLTSDGTLIQLSKDGTTVGSIGVESSGLLLGSGNVGLRFIDSGQDRIIPRKTTLGNADALIDLGDSGSRFKDLYISGAVNLGDTYGVQWGTGNERITGVNTGNSLRFVTNNAEAMRIDTSGNVLVGKTAPTITTTGVELRPNGQVFATQSGNYPLLLNRTTSDGDIVQFRKDSSTVGSVSSNGGSASYNSNSGVIFLGNDQTNHFKFLTSQATGQPRFEPSGDNTIDVGRAALRFKDLYLGGGVYVGGTGSANHLDDYEEGTWTPALGPGSGQSYGNRSGHYTKVGRMVTAYFGARLTAGTFTGGEATITGLPFAVHTTGSYQEPQFVIYTLGGAPTGQTNGLNNGAYLPGQVSFYLGGGESKGRGRKYSANADQVLDANEVFDSNSFIKGIVTYYTS